MEAPDASIRGWIYRRTMHLIKYNLYRPLLIVTHGGFQYS